MDPKTPNEAPAVDVKALSDDAMSPEELERFLAEFAPKLNVEPESERWPRILVLDDGRLPHEYLLHLRDVAIQHRVDVIMPQLPILDEVAELNDKAKDLGRRGMLVMAGAGGKSTASMLAEILKNLPTMIEPTPAPDVECFIEAETIEVVKQPPPKKNKHNFKQFQNARHNYGPSTRRQFAQIRPPRRGGR